MIDRMKQWLLAYLDDRRLVGRRKKLSYKELEDYLITKKFSGLVSYQEADGYRLFVQVMSELEKEGHLLPIKKSGLNGRFPPLPSQWWLQPKVFDNLWNETKVLALSDLLDLSRYRQNPEWQTVEEWEHIEAIYSFLKNKDMFNWVTREERAFQLFKDEKFFTKEGRFLLQRLQLTLKDLKANVYGEPFVFWPSPTTTIKEAKTILIVENLSFYHTCRRLMDQHQAIVGIQPELLIYGEGKKIESSLSFLEKITNVDAHVVIHYAGDMDPEGWGIYVRLCQAYPDYKIQLAGPIYQAMADKGMTNKVDKEQNENRTYLKQVTTEWAAQGYGQLAKLTEELWKKKERIPQETLSLDTIHSATKGATL
ncbi:DUF2220 family protein [Pullulanibacillus sp. KACC 23026]|uniref:Wadjet anti-phage system protein JetD domain-containing protein n=1 Tax=Pullulanibacillus sp. KACC 23026 TaxID=3028315 RepID=UPI0023B0126F|nr:Wadjet anti-phage system protein JetD domain-containing protein [Pullulanibacillus sp. KACC 23026]WEG11167.1 DUF2220 family protein [Pullulanibacillus sp. KACC 23026]